VKRLLGPRNMLSPYQAAAPSNSESPVLNGGGSEFATRYVLVISSRVSWVIFDSSIWDAFTNCSSAATSVVPDKPRPHNSAENDVPSFNYHRAVEERGGFVKIFEKCGPRLPRDGTDIGARDHGHMKEVSGSDLGRRTNRGKTTRSDCRLP
jgi:hypothetical protein